MLVAISATAIFALAFGAGHSIAPGICGDGSALLVDPELLGLIGPWRLAATWLLMLFAMTPALLVQPIRHLWYRSFADRRLAMLATFGLSYLLVWTMAGVPLVVLAIKIRAAGAVGWSIAASIALAWQLSPARQACLNQCHRRPPLAGFGIRSIGSAASYGLSHGTWCTASCWPWMLAPLALLQHQLVAMAVATVFVIAERMDSPAPPRWGWGSCGRAMRAVAALVLRWVADLARRAAHPPLSIFHPLGRRNPTDLWSYRAD